MMKNKIKLSPLSSLSSIILKIGLPLISAVFLYIFFFILDTPENKRAWVASSAIAMLEYAIMSLTIIICGSLIVDTVVKNNS